MDQPFPCEDESAFKKARRVTAERVRSPQVPVLLPYVPPPAELKPRQPTNVVVVRNDTSHILLRTRFKQLFEDLERQRRNKSTPTRRVTIADHLNKRARDSAPSTPTAPWAPEDAQGDKPSGL